MRHFPLRLQRWWPWLLPLLAVQPILVGHVPWQGDGLLHLYRIAALERAVAMGDIFPRWLPDLGLGYGFPLFNYYAPFSYYVALPFRWLGLGLPTAVSLSYALALWVMGLGAYQLGRELGGARGGTTAALALLYAPYTLINLHHRAALAELWGLAWLVVCLWLVQQIATRPSRWPWLTLAYSALLFSHNITALIGTPVLIGLVIWQGAKIPPFKTLAPLAGGLLITAFFWLPALAETAYVQIGRVADGGNFSYVNHFLDWRELLAWPPTADPLLVNPSLPRALGWGQLALLVYACLRLAIPWIARHRPQEPNTAPTPLSPFTFHLSLLILSLFMALPASQWLWDTVPLLPYVQFPWRFLGLAAVGVALVSAEEQGGRGAGEMIVHTLLLAFLLLTALPYLFPSAPPPLPHTADRAALIAFELETGWLGTTSAGDYLPTAVATLPPPASTLTVSRAGNQLTFSQFYFPGWQLWVDGQSIPLSASAPHGLLQATHPVGEHNLELRFGNTPLRTAANILSLLTWLLFVSWSARQLVSQSASPLPPCPPAPLLLLPLLLLVLLKTTYLDQNQTIFRRTAANWPMEVSVANDMRLLEVNLPSDPTPADETIDITLAWQAIAPTAELSIAVQLVDERGVRHGQSDNQHPAGLPITRWLPAQYGRDTHALRPLPGTPAGVYGLELIVYGTADGRQREWLNEGGLPVGVSYPLGQITIAPPRQPTAETDLPPMLRPPQPAITPELALLGYTGLPEQIGVGEVVPLVLYWQAGQALTHPPDTPITLRDEAGQVWLRWEAGRGAPQAGWAEGHIGREVRLLAVPALGQLGELKSGTYRLYVNETAVAPLAITAPSRLFTPPDWPVWQAAVGDVATLYGAQISQPNAETLLVELAWRADQLTATSYTVFVQLLGADGRPLAQSDQLPAHLGTPRPTSSWLPGEYVLDTHQLPLPPEPFTVLVGLYDAATGVRLGEVVLGEYPAPN